MLLRTGKTTLTETLTPTRTYVLTLSPQTMGRKSKAQKAMEADAVKRKEVATAAAAAAVERQSAQAQHLEAVQSVTAAATAVASSQEDTLTSK